MTIRTILTLENPVLQQKAKRVKQFNGALQTLADDMAETMRAAPGIGLAANQVGVLQRVIVVELLEDEENPQSGHLYAIVNPEIAKSSEEEEESEEGCLSVPGYVGDVWRHVWVTIKGQDTQGRDIRIKARDLLARVFQHEIDHLNGILFVDQVDSPEKIHEVRPKQTQEPEM